MSAIIFVLAGIILCRIIFGRVTWAVLAFPIAILLVLIGCGLANIGRNHRRVGYSYPKARSA